jgi:DNA-binding response OmpR family regulator
MMAEKGSHLPPVDILIAEDDPHVRFILRNLLETAGYRCAEAVDGLQALELARNYTPRCVLLDIVLPRMNGFDVARHLRADHRTRTARIHCVTGCTDPDTRERASRIGCDAFLTKPIDFSALLEVVKQEPRPAPLEWFGDLDMTAAEELLDRLERNGWTDLEVDCPDHNSFAVGGRRPDTPPSHGPGGKPGV